MSRKTIAGIIAVVAAILTFFKEQFGLAIDPVAVVGGLTALILYVLLEAKLDWKKVQAQANRFTDPKFLLALASVIIVALNDAFGWGLPVEIITTILTVVMGFLFGKDFKKLTAA